jgi:hypothetical protein
MSACSTHTSPARESTYISPTPPQSNDDLAELKQNDENNNESNGHANKSNDSHHNQ